MRRAQANLLALAVALVLLTAAVGVAMLAVSGAFAAADGEPRERATARAVAERLVAPDGPLAREQNVLDAGAVAAFDAAALRSALPATRDRAVRVTVGDEVVAETGDAGAGTTVRRLVLLESRDPLTRRQSFGERNGSLLLAPTARATVSLGPEANATALWANGRLVRRDPAGLNGTYELSLDRARRTRLALNNSGGAPVGPVTVTTYPWTTAAAELAVTVDG